MPEVLCAGLSDCWCDARHQTVRAAAGTRRVSAFWPHHITRRPTLGLPLSLAQHSARPNAEVGGSSPPRPTTVSSLSVTKSIEFRPWVKSHLSLVGEPIQVGVLPRDQAVAHREDVSARDSERLAFSGAAHDIFRDEVLHTEVNAL